MGLTHATLSRSSLSTRRVRGLGLGIALSLLGCRPAGTGSTEAPSPGSTTAAVDPAQAELDARLAWIEAQLEQARIDGHIPGMSVAIVRDDEVIFAKGFGLADLEAETPVTPETRFA